MKHGKIILLKAINSQKKINKKKLIRLGQLNIEYLSKKYNLAILSNWLRDSQIGRLKNANLYKYFSDFYITEDIPMKPNKESFEIAIGNYAKDECIMIGDSLKTDIKGAVNAGIKAIYLNKTSEEDINTENITTIHKLSELRKIL